MMDSFVGVREKTGVLFAYGLLLMKQHDLQESRQMFVALINACPHQSGYHLLLIRNTFDFHMEINQLFCFPWHLK